MGNGRKVVPLFLAPRYLSPNGRGNPEDLSEDH